MRYLSLVPVLTLIALGTAQAQTPPAPPAAKRIRLLIQGDDMGAAHGMNTATIRAYKEGILRSTNVIVPGPWFPEAVELLAQNPGLDVGVHLCLTSEWQGLKWRSLTQAPGLVDADGYFFPMVFPEKGLPRHTSLKEADPRTEDVERELRRQIEVARRHIPHLSYLSSHMGFPALNPAWRDLLQRISNDTGIPLMENQKGLNYLFSVLRGGRGFRQRRGARRQAGGQARAPAAGHLHHGGPLRHGGPGDAGTQAFRLREHGGRPCRGGRGLDQSEGAGSREAAQHPTHRPRRPAAARAAIGGYPLVAETCVTEPRL